MKPALLRLALEATLITAGLFGANYLIGGSSLLFWQSLIPLGAVSTVYFER